MSFVHSSVLPHLMDPRARGLSVIKNAYSSLLIHTKQLLLVKFCGTTTEIGSVMGRDTAINKDKHEG